MSVLGSYLVSMARDPLAFSCDTENGFTIPHFIVFLSLRTDARGTDLFLLVSLLRASRYLEVSTSVE